MTDLHTAAKQALEALELEEAQTHYPPQWLLKAIAALRQALANSALDKMAENARELGLDYELQDKDPDLIEQPAQQEPVSFLDWYDNAHWGNEDFKAGCWRAWDAALAQRKPLTDEQWQEIAAITGCLRIEKRGRNAILRVFEEAAHGIKENA